MDKYEGHIPEGMKGFTQPIPSCPGYFVDVWGDVYGNPFNWRGYGWRKLTQQINSHGYPTVRLTVKGKRKRYLIHKLVAEVFMSNRPSKKHEIRHLDGDRAHNWVFNLRWGTRQDNADDREKHGNTSRGTKHSEAVKEGIKNARQV